MNDQESPSDEVELDSSSKSLSDAIGNLLNQSAIANLIAGFINAVAAKTTEELQRVDLNHRPPGPEPGGLGGAYLSWRLSLKPDRPQMQRRKLALIDSQR